MQIVLNCYPHNANGLIPLGRKDIPFLWNTCILTAA